MNYLGKTADSVEVKMMLNTAEGAEIFIFFLCVLRVSAVKFQPLVSKMLLTPTKNSGFILYLQLSLLFMQRFYYICNPTPSLITAKESAP